MTKEFKVPGFKPTKPFNTGYVMGSDPSMRKTPKTFNKTPRVVRIEIIDKNILKEDRSLRQRFIDVIK